MAILAAADTSGNWKYLSVIIGVADDIKRIHNNLGETHLHMRKMYKDERETVIKNIDIKGTVMARCFRVDRSQIIEEMKARLDKRKKIPIKRFIEDQYDLVLINRVRSTYQGFVREHSITFETIVFEIDHDLHKPFTKYGLKHKDKASVHAIADIIANCNSRGKELKNVYGLNICNELRDLLVKRLKI